MNGTVPPQPTPEQATVDRIPQLPLAKVPPQNAGEERPERGFVCRSCGAATHGRHIPAGWYLIQRATGKGERHLRLGLYCTLPCLMRAQRRLESGAAEHGTRLGLPEDDLRHYGDLLERALSYLHQGMTVRQAGDELGIPTRTLHGWLRAASISIAPDGTLPLPESSERQHPPLNRHQLRARQRGQNPVSTVHELTQAQILRDLTWSHVTTGPSHAPLFTFTLSATHTANSTTLTAEGRSTTKADARTAAAANFLQQLDANLD